MFVREVNNQWEGGLVSKDAQQLSILRLRRRRSPGVVKFCEVPLTALLYCSGRPVQVSYKYSLTKQIEFSKNEVQIRYLYCKYLYDDTAYNIQI